MAGAIGRRFVISTILFASIALISVLVISSPLFLDSLKAKRDDWLLLSNIGQTYGVASALLSVFALIGVSFSLILQARETKATREQALRALHGDLMRMAMDDPLYRACWGPFFSADEEDGQKAHMYVNMIFNHWLLMWELRAITETHLREISRTVLEGPIGRRFWQDVRALRMSSSGTRRERRFNRIIDAEYQEVVRLNPIAPVWGPPGSADPLPHAKANIARGFVSEANLTRLLAVLGVVLVIDILRKMAASLSRQRRT
ncbi:DUF6082 family protein [Microbispora hainanensis]|uniref:DUF6082 family protein n=1 Tax=Microbispora hainanensis TaxID=568844 RepID=UPI002E2AFCC1|nr:DUF6082 family protein [Microbispora hainanensis]